MALKREIKVFLESELRSYDQTKQEWESIQDGIIKGSACGDDSGIRGTDIGNTTQSKALQLISNRRLGQLERTIKAIEGVCTNLTEDNFRLVQMRYWDKPKTLTDDGIALQLNISRPTYYRIVDAILLALAKAMGLVD